MKSISTLFVIFALLFLLNGCRQNQTENYAEAPAPVPSPESKGPSNPQKLPKIVAFGNSLTAGYGLSIQESYPSVLQELLRSEGYGYEVINSGLSGDTTAGGVRRLEWVLQEKPEIVILELGANDILRGLSVDEMKSNLDRMISSIKESGATVVLAGMMAPTNLGPDYQKAVVNAYKELAAEHDVTFIPFLLTGVAGNQRLNLDDGVHPNAQGTKIVAGTVLQALKPHLKKS